MSAPFSLSRTPRLLRFLVAAALGPASVLANPTGGTVAAGSAAFNTSGSTLTVTTGGPQTIINWSGFGIAAGETTNILQPNSASTTLNRVTGGNVSAIYGTLYSNGGIILVNPNGILVGPGGVVNTQSFTASTLRLSDSAFLAGGSRTFRGHSRAGVVNLGTITASGGDIFLIARHVDNGGTLTAANGTVGLAAGTEVTLAESGEQRLSVAYTAGKAQGTGVNNTGTIDALRAELKANGNIYALAVNNGGVIRATGVSNVGGQVWITGTGGAVRNSGTVAAVDGNKGGDIVVTGKSVDLAGTAVLDASGANGGGTIKVGGGARGLDAAVANASETTVESGALLRADATAAGDGGSVVVWSDGTTTFRGAISARGGVDGGNGGAAEVSGHDFLAYAGFTDLRAPLGRTGLLLLDPADLTINATGTGTVTGSYLSASAVETALAGSDIEIQTSSSGTGNGDLTVAADVTWTGGTSLTLSAARNVTIDTGVTISHTSGAGNLSIHADNGATGTGTIFQNGTINLAGSTGSVSFYYNPTSYSSPTTFSGVTAGTGGSFTPYMLVNSLASFENIATLVNGGATTGSYALTLDLDLTGVSWAPIGNATTTYTGSFDGQNHTVSNLTLNGAMDYAGLFGLVQNGALANLTLQNVSVTDTQASSFAGGLVGRAVSENVSNIAVSGAVTATQTSAYGGGVAGSLDGGTDSRLSNSATVNAYTAGGIAGLLGRNNTTTLTAAYNTGAVTSAGNAAGGIIGTAYIYSTVSYAYNTATVTHSGNNGGGGIIGDAYGTLNNALSTGSASGTSAGGVVGVQFSGTTTDAYWNPALAGVTYGIFSASSTADSDSTLSADSVAATFYTTAGNWTGGAWSTSTWTIADGSLPTFQAATSPTVMNGTAYTASTTTAATTTAATTTSNAAVAYGKSASLGNGKSVVIATAALQPARATSAALSGGNATTTAGAGKTDSFSTLPGTEVQLTAIAPSADNGDAVSGHGVLGGTHGTMTYQNPNP